MFCRHYQSNFYAFAKVIKIFNLKKDFVFNNRKRPLKETGKLYRHRSTKKNKINKKKFCIQLKNNKNRKKKKFIQFVKFLNEVEHKRHTLPLPGEGH